MRRFTALHKAPKVHTIRFGLLVVVVLTFGAVGVYLLSQTKAATLTASVEAELGVVTPCAVTQSDVTASAGKAVLFRACDPPPDESPVFPTVTSTGPRTSNLTASGPVTSSSTGQIIENLNVNGNVNIRHDNVTVRNVRVNGTATYMITTSKKTDGSCPVNVRFEYIEINGANALENDIPIYSSCGNMTIDHAYIHNVGRSSRLTNNMTISNSYVFSNRTGDSGAHRGGVGINGGSDNVIYNNVLKCQGTGCSAAIPNYGDFAPVVNLRIEHNLLATTGGYCAYGGSLPEKPYPEGSNIDFIDNHFSTEFMPACGRYGPITGFANNVRGNEWRGNVWHETGLPVSAN
jgi:hypothetical protein